MKTLIPVEEHPSDMDFTELWCFALQHAIFVQRRLYNRLRKDIPYFLVWKRRPSVLDVIPFGSWMTVIDPQKHLLKKLDPKRASRNNFIGFTNNSSSGKLYWNHRDPRNFFRSHHNTLDITSTLAQLQASFASPALPPLSQLNQEKTTQLNTCIIPPSQFDYIDRPFPPSSISSFTFTLPPHPTSIGALICDDKLLNMPYIQRSVINSAIYKALPAPHRHNQFILSINSEGPITKTFAVSLLQKAQKRKIE
jgi:hypothetical protein